MSKVLLVDTNISSSPIYRFLVDEGHNVAVIGGNPKDYLARIVPCYIEGDYSDPDLLAAVVAEHGFDYIVPGCNDRSYHACAQLNASGRFPGLDSLSVTETINNKQLFRTFSETSGLPVPRVYKPQSCPLDRALIVKPVDAFSGRGVTILECPTELGLAEAMTHAQAMSGSATCIIEEYVTGQLYSHSCFIKDGQVLLDFIVVEHGSANPFVVDTSRVVFDFPSEILQRLRDCVERMALALDLVDGLVHTQFILQKTDIWLIEVTRRCPGDLYSQLIEMSTGIPYAALYARPFIGMAFPQELFDIQPVLIMRHTMTLSAEASLEHLRFTVPLQIERMYPISIIGDKVRESPFSRIALIFVRASSQADLFNLFDRTLRRDLYTVES